AKCRPTKMERYRKMSSYKNGTLPSRCLWSLVFGLTLSIFGCQLADNSIRGQVNASTDPGPLQVSSLTNAIYPGENLTLAVSGGKPPYQYALIEGSGNISPTTGVFTANNTLGENTVRVTDASGASVDLVIYTDPKKLLGDSDVSINFGSGMQIETDTLWIFALDIDNDGNMDLVSQNKTSGQTQVYASYPYVNIHPFGNTDTIKEIRMGNSFFDWKKYFLNTDTGSVIDLESYFTPADAIYFPEVTDDSLYILFLADISGDGRRLFMLPTDGSSGPVSLNNSNFTPGDHTHEFKLTPDQTKVVYSSNQDGHSGYSELFVVDLSNPTVVTPLSADIGSGGPRVTNLPNSFRISPDGQKVVFSGNESTYCDLFSANIDGTNHVKLKTGSGNTYDPLSSMIFKSDSTSVIFTGDFEVSSRDDLFTATIGNAGSGVRINQVGDAGGFLLYYGSSPAYVLSGDIYTFTIGSYDSLVAVTSTTASLQFQSMKFSPNLMKFSVLGITAGVYELYVSDYGVAGGTKMHANLPSHASVASNYNWLSNSSGVIYMADVAINGRYQLFFAPTDASGEVDLTENLLIDGSVSDHYLLSDDRIIFIANPENGKAQSLYIMNPDGTGLKKLSGRTTHDGEQITALEIAADELSLHYKSDRFVDGVYQLYELAIPAP
ncbi:MAG: PD40 domain-containing protein, partial [Bdellovibrionales bacterium]|nr:PD40 domain-containing protein [Bdellovibrionales bacterium]